jgi:hypothetical protein
VPPPLFQSSKISTNYAGATGIGRVQEGCGRIATANATEIVATFRNSHPHR